MITMIKRTHWLSLLSLLASFIFLVLPVAAQQSPAPAPSELEELKGKVKILTDEVDSLKTKLVLPETAELKSLYGLGPAASKIYQLGRGLSIGGYGETNFSLLIDDKGTGKNIFDFVRFVLYAGYKFTDRILLNAEIEFEHAKVGSTTSAGSGDVEIEFAYLDFLLEEQANIRAGLILIPVGFLNEIHEPPFYFGNKRPEVETRLIPTTWRSNGVGLYGTLLPGLDYRTYGVTSFNAMGFSNSGVRGGRQSGNREFGDSLAWTGRLDYTMIPGLLVGTSFFWGDTGQDQLFGGQKVDANLVMYDVHAQYQLKGLHLRGLFTQTHLADARQVTLGVSAASRPVAERMWGAYLEAAYDILPLVMPGTRQSLSPFARFEWANTQAEVPAGFSPDNTKDIEVINVGLSYKPIPNVVIKLDYRKLTPKSGTIADELNTGFGFAF
ncbi:MAG TPA: hypothetical protein VJO34_16365 [Methylomirabilota bacterium]|nr:hypothetical protein [Methylomirabilota bacterium]